MQAAVTGGESCSCWVPVFNRPQTTPDLGSTPGVMPRMCGDCAYRKGSPEREGNPAANGDAALLERITVTGEQFWCHDGLRRQTGWTHPSGIEVPLPPEGVDNFDPPIVAGVPYRADGTAGALCAGWSARRARHLAREEQVSA